MGWLGCREEGRAGGAANRCVRSSAAALVHYPVTARMRSPGALAQEQPGISSAEMLASLPYRHSQAVHAGPAPQPNPPTSSGGPSPRRSSRRSGSGAQRAACKTHTLRSSGSRSGPLAARGPGCRQPCAAGAQSPSQAHAACRRRSGCGAAGWAGAAGGHQHLGLNLSPAAAPVHPCGCASSDCMHIPQSWLPQRHVSAM